MDAAELRAMQAPIKDRYKSDPNAALITLKAKGSLDDTEHRLQGRDRPRARRRGPASGDRRLRAWSLLRRHAAGGAGRLRRRDAEGGVDRARHSAEVRHGVGRGRSRFPRHARRRQGRAGRLPRDPPALRRRHRRAAGASSTSCSSSPSAIAWSIRPSQGPAGGHQAAARVMCTIGSIMDSSCQSRTRLRHKASSRQAVSVRRRRGLLRSVGNAGHDAFWIACPPTRFWLALALKMAVTAGFVVAGVAGRRAAPARPRRDDRDAADRGGAGLCVPRARPRYGVHRAQRARQPRRPTRRPVSLRWSMSCWRSASRWLSVLPPRWLSGSRLPSRCRRSVGTLSPCCLQRRGVCRSAFHWRRATATLRCRRSSRRWYDMPLRAAHGGVSRRDRGRHSAPGSARR